MPWKILRLSSRNAYFPGKEPCAATFSFPFSSVATTISRRKIMIDTKVWLLWLRRSCWRRCLFPTVVLQALHLYGCVFSPYLRDRDILIMWGWIRRDTIGVRQSPNLWYSWRAKASQKMRYINKRRGKVKCMCARVCLSSKCLWRAWAVVRKGCQKMWGWGQPCETQKRLHSGGKREGGRPKPDEFLRKREKERCRRWERNRSERKKERGPRGRESLRKSALKRGWVPKCAWLCVATRFATFYRLCACGCVRVSACARVRAGMTATGCVVVCLPVCMHAFVSACWCVLAFFVIL